MPNDSINDKLRRAVYNENLEEVKALLAAGADANQNVNQLQGSYSRCESLLHVTNNAEIAKQLLLSGAYVDKRNKYQETPLLRTVVGGNLEMVRVLLKHGARVNAMDRKGNNALNKAVKKSFVNLGIVKELLEYGADINQRNRERRPFDYCDSPLDHSVNRFEFAKLLIKFTVVKNYENILDLTRYTDIRNYNELASRLDDCVSEVVQMKTDEIIHKGYPLYEFVTNKSISHLSLSETCGPKPVSCSNKLSVRLTKIDCSLISEHYPVYSDIILDVMKPFLERAGFLNKLRDIQFYCKLDLVNQDVKEKEIFLDHYSTYSTTEYLSNDDLLNLILAFKDSNTGKCIFQSLSSSGELVVDTGT